MHQAPLWRTLIMLALAVAACGPWPAGQATPVSPTVTATPTFVPPTPWDCGWPYCGPTPSATPGEGDPPGGTPGPAAGNPLAALLPEPPLPAPPGWSVAPCEGDAPFLCVAEGDRFLGSVEMGVYPLATMPNLQQNLAEAGVTPGALDPSDPEQAAQIRAALRAFVEEYYGIFREDRAVTYPADLTFTPMEPEEIRIGRLPGLAYGFAGLYPDGRAYERWLSYATFDGRDLLIFVAFHAPDSPGSFPSDEALRRFEPSLRELLGRLRLE